MKVYQDVKEARVGLVDYFRFYDDENPHQALGYLAPAEVFNSISVEAACGLMIQSLMLKTQGTA